MGSKVTGQALGQAQSLGTQAQNQYGSLAPTLQAEATHPTGYDPATLAKMNTAAQQTAGGTQAGAVGQGALLAARTKNAGTADAAIAQSARTAGQDLSNAGLKTQMADASLKNQQQQAGLTGEQNLYNTNLGASQRALGIAASAPPSAMQQLGIQAGGDILKAATTAATF